MIEGEPNDFGSSLSASSAPSDGVSYIAEKLRRIVIPSIDFENTTLEEAIAQAIARHHGGAITVRSAAGQGAVFMVRLSAGH